jgi:hypothetical protein
MSLGKADARVAVAGRAHHRPSFDFEFMVDRHKQRFASNASSMHYSRRRVQFQ